MHMPRQEFIFTYIRNLDCVQADFSARSFLPQNTTPSYYRHLIDCSLLTAQSSTNMKVHLLTQNKLENCLHVSMCCISKLQGKSRQLRHSHGKVLPLCTVVVTHKKFTLCYLHWSANRAYTSAPTAINLCFPPHTHCFLEFPTAPQQQKPSLSSVLLVKASHSQVWLLREGRGNFTNPATLKRQQHMKGMFQNNVLQHLTAVSKWIHHLFTVNFPWKPPLNMRSRLPCWYLLNSTSSCKAGFCIWLQTAVSNLRSRDKVKTISKKLNYKMFTRKTFWKSCWTSLNIERMKQ